MTPFSGPDGSPYRFAHRLRVRWGECDMQGIVFNPHYMAYVDVALTEYWRAIGMAYPHAFAEVGVDTFMVAASQSYKAPAHFDDELDVTIRTLRLGTTSLQIAFEIQRGGRGLFYGEATYVVAEKASMKPIKLPDRLIDAIANYERVPPQCKRSE